MQIAKTLCRSGLINRRRAVRCTNFYCSKQLFLPEVLQTVGVQKADVGSLHAYLLDLNHKSVTSLPIRSVFISMTSARKVQQTFSSCLSMHIMSSPPVSCWVCLLHTNWQQSLRLIHVSSSWVQCQYFHLVRVNKLNVHRWADTTTRMTGAYQIASYEWKAALLMLNPCTVWQGLWLQARRERMIYLGADPNEAPHLCSQSCPLENCTAEGSMQPSVQQTPAVPKTLRCRG